MVVLLLLTPNINVLPNLPSVRIEELLLLSLALTALFRLSRGRQVHLAWGIRQNFLVAFSALIVFSILLGAHQGYGASVLDLNQLIRLGKFVAVYTLAVTAFHLSPDTRATILRVFRTISICGVLLTLIVIQQYFNLFGLNELYVRAIAPTAFESLVGGYPFPRPVGLIGNPNELGFIFVVSSLITIDLLVSHRFRVRWLVAFGIQVGALVLTLSRTSLAAFLIGAVWLSVRAPNRKGSGSSAQHLAVGATVLGVIGGMGLLVVLNQEVFQAIGWRFARILTGEVDTSLQSRIGRWRVTYEAFTESPLFGLGPHRHAPEIALRADSE
jgi:O-antigen ligase